MFTMRSVARVELGLRLIDTPHSIKPWWENQRYTFIIIDIMPGVRLHRDVKVVAIHKCCQGYPGHGH